MKTPLLNLLCTGELLSAKQADELQTQMQAQSVSALTALMASGFISGKALADYLATHLNLPLVKIEDYPFASLSRQLNLPELIHRYQALPITLKGQWLTLAAGDPTQPQLREDFRFATAMHIELVIAETDSLYNALHSLTEHKNLPHHHAEQQLVQQLREDEQSYDASVSEDDSAPVSQYLRQVLQKAWQNKASDIHFEPYESSYRIRMRLNGLLVTTHTPPHTVSRRLASRIKVLANLNIAERRQPQDGRIKFTTESHHDIDLRVSVLPTRWGEKIVLRLLNTQEQPLELNHSGLTTTQLKLFRQAIHKPQGMVLITGPTGSGKTVTLYSALNELNHESKNISTVEDPVEISLAGINQIQTNEKNGLNFSQILRAMLRQDPDIIMVGEIRDKETATIALRAAQTGHLVFSTLHTNSAQATFIRLQHMGFEPYQLVAAIRLIVAQRLVRRLCPLCKQPVTGSSALTRQLKLKTTIFQANSQGCHACIGGYQGRLGIYELLTPVTGGQPSPGSIHPDLQPGFSDKSFTLHNTLWQDGLEKLEQGLTSADELYRVLESPEQEEAPDEIQCR